MTGLSELEALGLTLPSMAYMIGAVVFGIIGIAAYRCGKRQGRRVTRWIGVALMLYPYAVAQTWLLYTVGIALCAGIFIDRD
ncbi:MAG: hypothetical protein KKC79_11985 [Gammaproteobacteria bacterium]|nr:hypothetical protein [Gammaproteobacteria bacterium]MBU1440025.1 hypothetical protein [Gammaproteobacteria bacterium]MBU2285172.1 hypothetical protein [Gammaproteobacteria bacterium]MBU2409350.1 hypothetical protein [Gammaproteobacteria bacterium]